MGAVIYALREFIFPQSDRKEVIKSDMIEK